LSPLVSLCLCAFSSWPKSLALTQTRRSQLFIYDNHITMTIPNTLVIFNSKKSDKISIDFPYYYSILS
jgi:hypothetical protein